MASNAERLMALFSGNISHHGTHGVPDLDQNGVKWGIKRTARTLREPVTLSLWEKHLEGKRPLGVVPIRDDSTCVFGSIDIDDYDVETLDVIKKVESNKLPLIACRSKSGGLHLFMFTTDPVSAELMQSTLRDIAASIGYASSEIFPKQTKLHVDRGDQGSWMVMPYFGNDYDGKLRMQHGLKRTGAEMTLSEFLSAAEKLRVAPDQLTLVRVKKPKKERPDFSDGPPCLVHLTQHPIGQGGQNNTMFQMGVYFKRAFPENWREKMEEANQKYMRPPLPSDNLASVIKSLEKKDYQYKCSDQPMCAHCDAMLCRTRKFGVGAGGVYPKITSISKMASEPVVWFVDVEGKRIAMGTDELQDYRKFHRLCMDHTNKSFAPISQKAWFGLVNEALAEVAHIDAPPDVGTGGHFREMLEEFLTNRQRGLVQADLLHGRPWEDEEHGVYWFQITPLMRLLEKTGLKNLSRNDIARRIREMGGVPDDVKIKGSNRHCWKIPTALFGASPSADPPPIEGSPI